MRKIIKDDVQAINPDYNGQFESIIFNSDLCFKGASFEVSVADICPICNYSLDMNSEINNYVNFHDIHSDNQKEFHIMSAYLCPHCHNIFIVYYTMKFDIYKTAVETKQFIYPYTKKDIILQQEVFDISPKFYDIFNQCLIAKKNGLFHLYGMGFRKAIEQLVTDFIIHENPDDKERILEKNLHKRIDNYIKESDLKTKLLACKWLGNNETHYDNCNSKEDLEFLEILIDDIIQHINRELRLKKAKSINDVKGKKPI